MGMTIDNSIRLLEGYLEWQKLHKMDGTGIDEATRNLIDVVRKYQMMQADYENRLKADMVIMLEDLDLQIDELAAYNLEAAKVQRLIRDKINVLRGEKDETGKSNK